MRGSGIRLNLKDYVSKTVLIKIRIFNTYLQGFLVSFDSYSNILLENAREYIRDTESGQLTETQVFEGPIILRGDSIITLSSGIV